MLYTRQNMNLCFLYSQGDYNCIGSPFVMVAPTGLPLAEMYTFYPCEIYEQIMRLCLVLKFWWNIFDFCLVLETVVCSFLPFLNQFAFESGPIDCDSRGWLGRLCGRISECLHWVPQVFSQRPGVLVPFEAILCYNARRSCVNLTEVRACQGFCLFLSYINSFVSNFPLTNHTMSFYHEDTFSLTINSPSHSTLAFSY